MIGGGSIFRSYLLTCWGVWLCMLPWLAQAHAYTEGRQYVQYGEIAYWPAGEKPVGWMEAKAIFNAGKFIKNADPNLNLGIAQDNYWIRFEVSNLSPARRLFITLENSRLNRVEIFILNKDSLVSHPLLGDQFPFREREVPLNQFSFPIDFTHFNQVEVWMLVMHKGNTLQMPIMVADEAHFLLHAESNYLIIGVFTGFFGIAFIFGLFFLFNTRDLLFLYYSGYIATSTLWLWATEGYGFQYLWPDSTTLATRFGPAVSAMSSALFMANCLQFARPYDQSSAFRKVLYGILVLMGIVIVLPLLPFIPMTAGTSRVFLSLFFGMNALIAISMTWYFAHLSRQGHTPVRYYFLAVAVTILVSIVVMFRSTGMVHIPVSIGILMGVSYVIEVTLMTAGITKQFYQYKKEKEDTLLAYLEQQKTITAKILETQEKERLRIGRELHDDIGSGLTQITLMSESARQHIAAAEPQKEIRDIAETSRRLVQNMGEIIWSLDPENKSISQLMSYLREQLSSLLEYAGIPYHINLPEVDTNVPIGNAALRNIPLITKEAVHNAVKHSRAKNLGITCTYDHHTLHFEVADDGVGIENEFRRNGHGMANIRRRVQELGGQLEIESKPGLGTRVRYHIPCG